MAKRIKSEIGNVIMIPVTNELYCIARVINKAEDTCLYELYISKPFGLNDEINLENIMKCKKVMTWGYDDFIKKGRWKIVDNIMPNYPIEMPYFLCDNGIANGQIVLYLQKGDYNDPLKQSGEKIFITSEEAGQYMKNGITNSGIGFPYATESVFRMHLIYNNFLTEESPLPEDYVDERQEKERKELEPFTYFRENNKFYIILEIDGEYRKEIFEQFGYNGTGDDWEELAKYYIAKNMPELLEMVEFDSESGTFVALCRKGKPFKKFLKEFKNACEDDETMSEMLGNVLKSS
ncbi:MAG: hypothetical protein IJ736_05030 [Firmicutes bacterium]|nr:hypothetical protein [Bacillota bacterium]